MASKEIVTIAKQVLVICLLAWLGLGLMVYGLDKSDKQRQENEKIRCETLEVTEPYWGYYYLEGLDGMRLVVESCGDIMLQKLEEKNEYIVIEYMEYKGHTVKDDYICFYLESHRMETKYNSYDVNIFIYPGHKDSGEVIIESSFSSKNYIYSKLNF